MGRLLSSLPFGLVLVSVLTWAAYSGALDLDFVSFDDRGYVTENPAVQGGLSAEGLHYAFTSNKLANWHPLTWLSHMATCEVFGLDPAGHHGVNVVLHWLNGLLLLLLLRELTGDTLLSMLVAALFAVHPLHVESVAWVAERKDVLSTLFWILTTWAWLRWVRRPRVATYALMLGLFALGLMSKAMLVTLPFTLLLFDLWPLGRWRLGARGAKDEGPALGSLVKEKLPLFVMVVALSILTFVVQQSVGAVGSADSFPVARRFANAVVAAETYLVQTVWPEGLAVFYPYPSELAGAAVLRAGAVLAILSGLAFALRRRVPAFGVGWLWFLGTLVPVIGLVQVGNQAHADRYTYVPHIGLFLGLVVLVLGRSAADAESDALRGRRGLGALALLLLAAACVPLTRTQVGHWRDDEALFGHALEVTDDNYLAHDALALALKQKGRLDEAEGHYREALRIRPNYALAHQNYGVLHLDRGRPAAAIASFQSALSHDPKLVGAWSNLAAAFGATGRLQESLDAGLEALAIDPFYPGARGNVAFTSLLLGRFSEALEHQRAALELDPSLALRPQNLEFAWVLATHPDAGLRNGAEAEAMARAFSESVGFRNVYGVEALVAALAEQGRFDEARAMAQQTLAALRSSGRAERVQRFEGYLAALAERRPIRSTSRLISGEPR